MSDLTKSVPLTCHGHSRPITKIEFSSQLEDGEYFVLSGSKDMYPMLRDGTTGDWVGTFLGHKGAVWDVGLSKDTQLAATSSADFTAKVWSTMTGECLHTLQHDHIVHAIAFPHAVNPCVVVTGGRDRKLRIWDFSAQSNGVNGISTGMTSVSTGYTSVRQFELGSGVHTGTIKSIVWNTDPNVITTASEDKKIRWWDLRANSPILTRDVIAEPTSMQLTTRDSSNVISVTAGKKVYLYNGAQHGTLTKEIDMDHEVVSAAIDTKTNTLITGSASDTWVHVYDLIQGRETSTMKGHHGPVWTISYSPDGKIIGTGSEDGTIKLWKSGKEPYGLWKN